MNYAKSSRPLALLGLGLFLALSGSSFPAFGQDAPGAQTGDYIPGRLIVKYKAAAARTSLRQPAAMKPVAGSPSLDTINARFGVRKAVPLFRKAQARSMAQAAADFSAKAQTVKDKFPVRSRRAPAGAVIPDLSNIYVLEVSTDTDLKALAETLSRDPSVEYALPDRRIHFDMTPNDPYWATSGTWGQAYEDLWHLKKDRGVPGLGPGAGTGRGGGGGGQRRRF